MNTNIKLSIINALFHFSKWIDGRRN